MKTITNIVNGLITLGHEIERVDIQKNILGSYCGYVYFKDGAVIRVYENGQIEKEV